MKAGLIAKTAGAVGVASTGSIGTVFVYRYLKSPYEIEKTAMEKNSSWIITDPTPEDSKDSKKFLKVGVSIEIADDKGASSNTKKWTCEIISESFDSSNEATNKTKLRNALNTYFVGYSSFENPRTIQISEEVRRGFVKNCSKHRKLGEQSHTKVTSEVKISLAKLEKSLKTIFGGISREVSLNEVEKKIHKESQKVTFTATDFSPSTPGSTPITTTITAANEGSNQVLSSSEPWTCKIEATAPANSGAGASASTNTSELKTKLDTEIKKDESKKGLLESCARNRMEEVSTLTLKLVLVKGSQDKLQFDEGQWSSVFAGTWINLR